jgi:Family of unknown function (DUF6278)
MKIVAIVLIALALVSLGYLLFKRETATTERKFGSTDEFVQWLASEAVEDARKNNGIELDYTPASIQRVEEILSQVHDQYAKDPKSVSVTGLGSAYGAYIGEVIRRTEPGAKWERDDPAMGEKTYPIIWGGGSSFPLAWCIKRIENGPEDNVWVKYKVLKQKRQEKAPDVPK